MTFPVHYAAIHRLDRSAKLVAEPGTDRLWVPSVTVNQDLGWADLTSVTSYYWRSFRRVQDGTFSDSLGLGNFVVDPTSTPPCSGVLNQANCQKLYNTVSRLPAEVYYNNTIAQDSEELRLASKPYDPASNWPITWVSGVYWSDEVTKWTDNEYTPGLNAAFTTAGLDAAEVASLVGWGGTPPASSNTNQYSGGAPFPGDLNYFSHRHYETRQYSAFGEVNYYVEPTLRLTAGLRYLYAREAFDRNAGAYWNAFYVVNTPPASRSYALTPKVAIDWDVTPEDTVYANVSRGFRLGSVNRPVAVDSCIVNGTINGFPSPACAGNLKSYGFSSVPNGYAPDKLWNYEIGDKARLFDNRLSIDAALFYIKWDQIQQDVFLPQDWDFFTNTGSADITGFEWEIRGKVTEELTLGASGSFTHALLVTTGLILAPNGQPYHDAPVEGVPIWSGKLSADYSRPLSDTVDGFARADWTFTGHSHGTFAPGEPDYERPAYALVGASVGVDFDAYEISVFAKNLLNDRTLIQQPNVQTVNEGYRPWPRIVGVAASVDF
jgi:outer membrane receptor protein involved in Fe transport